MSTSQTQKLNPPAFMQLAGHPVRWRLMRELGRSDRMVHELIDLVDEPQNLVSYHLSKLRSGGLVAARRSSADGRDVYYSVDLTRIGRLLTETGAAVHPGLRLAPPTRDTAHNGLATLRVLFLCTGNSSRSQMAEALARTRSNGMIEAHSAGSHPKPLHPNAVRVMREEHDIDLVGQRSKHLTVYTDEQFDRVISLCDRVREVCPEFPGEPDTSHWSIPDPAATAGDDATSYPAFQETANELETRIKFLVSGLRTPDTRRRKHDGI